MMDFNSTPFNSFVNTFSVESKPPTLNRVRAVITTTFTTFRYERMKPKSQNVTLRTSGTWLNETSFCYPGFNKTITSSLRMFRPYH